MLSALPPGVDRGARIGAGGIADVYAGEWEGRTAAIKVLREPDRPGLRKRFLREGRLLMQFDHPGLVHCRAVLDGPRPALVLELLAGASLDVVLQRGALAPERVEALARVALRTLAHLHERGVVHRDLKSSNVWVGDDGRFVLLDLGLAADAADPLTTTLGEVIGTYAYMAPEQIAGAATDHRVDLYSLGVTLYEALCGERPFRGRGLGEYLRAHRGGGATPIGERVPDTPLPLAALVDRLMARDPAARPASAPIALALLSGEGGGTRRQLASPPLVARDEARRAIDAALAEGGVVRLVGELGSGVGAAARLARALAEAGGVEHATVRCHARRDVNALVSSLAEELSVFFGEVAPTLPGVCAALGVLQAQDGRVMVVVEDADLAPPEVAGLLARIAEVPGLALVLTGPSLAEAPPGRQVALRPLEREEVAALLAEMLGTAALPVGLADGIHRASGGLPAFVVAIAREHAARGGLWCEGGGEDGSPRWRWDPTAPLSPGPDTTRVIERALDALVPAARGLVRALAVAGEPVPLEVLLLAADADPSGADLGPALRTGLVALRSVRGEEWVAFQRAALEPIVRAGVAKAEARALHQRFAEAARARPAGDWEARFTRLHGALGVRDPAETERLVELGEGLVAAGRPAVGLGVLDVATQLPLDPGPVLARLALARCDALLRLGRLPEANLTLEAGRAVAAALGDEPLVRRAALANLEIALALGTRLPDDARERVEIDGGHEDRRRLAVAGAVAMRLGDLEGAEDAYAAALAAHPADAVAVDARLGLARVAERRGDLPAASTALRGLASELAEADRPVGACEALVRLAEVRVAEGRLAEALGVLEEADDLAETRAAPWLFAEIGVARARVHLAAHDLPGAGARLATHAPCAEPAAPWRVRAEWLALTAAMRLARGDGPAGLDAHLRAAEAASVTPDAPRASFHTGMVALLTADSRGVGEAVDALSAFGVHALTAELLLFGAATGRDPEVLVAAEEEARAAGDRLLLLRVLHARGDPAEGEAAAIADAALAGLEHPLRAAALRAPAVRWSLGERDGGGRDTGG